MSIAAKIGDEFKEEFGIRNWELAACSWQYTVCRLETAH